MTEKIEIIFNFEAKTLSIPYNAPEGLIITLEGNDSPWTVTTPEGEILDTVAPSSNLFDSCTCRKMPVELKGWLADWNCRGKNE